MNNKVREFKLNYLYELSLIPKDKRKHIDLYIDNDGTDKEEFLALKDIEKDIVNFIKKGNNLYLHSVNAGNGKTSWTLRLANTYLNNICESSELRCRVLFISVPQYLLAIKDNISTPSEYVRHIKDNVYKADLVIWDDVATKGVTQYEAENLFSILDGRLNSNKSNIFTSNLGSDEIHQAMGDRLASRIINVSYEIELKGRDKRTLKL